MLFFDDGLKEKYEKEMSERIRKAVEGAEDADLPVEYVPFIKVFNSLRGVVVIDATKEAAPNYSDSLTQRGKFTLAVREEIWNGIPRANEALGWVVQEKIFGHLFDLPVETGIGELSIGVHSGQRWAKETNPRLVFTFKTREWPQNIEWVVRLLRKLSHELPKEVKPE